MREEIPASRGRSWRRERRASSGLCCHFFKTDAGLRHSSPQCCSRESEAEARVENSYGSARSGRVRLWSHSRCQEPHRKASVPRLQALFQSQSQLSIEAGIGGQNDKLPLGTLGPKYLPESRVKITQLRRLANANAVGGICHDMPDSTRTWLYCRYRANRKVDIRRHSRPRRVRDRSVDRTAVAIGAPDFDG